MHSMEQVFAQVTDRKGKFRERSLPAQSARLLHSLCYVFPSLRETGWPAVNQAADKSDSAKLPHHTMPQSNQAIQALQKAYLDPLEILGPKYKPGEIELDQGFTHNWLKHSD